MFPLDKSARPGMRTAGEREALQVCARCAVLAACREEVLAAEMPYGVAGGMTVADRRAERARRRGLDCAQPATSPAAGFGTSQPSEGTVVGPAAAATTGLSAEDAALEAVLDAQAEFGPAAETGRVRELVAGRGPAVASRWEVALAAATLLRLGHTLSATARALGEQYTQVKRWHDRDQRGGALILGERGTGTRPLARPAASIDAPSPAAAPASAAAGVEAA
ncbi:WhiB family transcriptional regulator [Actinomycetospora sp. SF1]|nr:WhiB family transcriptional regulator [Actinomycetospora soli]